MKKVSDEDYIRLLGYFEESSYLEIAYEFKEELIDKKNWIWI